MLDGVPVAELMWMRLVAFVAYWGSLIYFDTFRCLSDWLDEAGNWKSSLYAGRAQPPSLVTAYMPIIRTVVYLLISEGLLNLTFAAYSNEHPQILHARPPPRY
jgi:hypothetical protein